MCVQTTAFADISTGNGILDRDFDADRTVYYVEITDEDRFLLGIVASRIFSLEKFSAKKLSKVLSALTCVAFSFVFLLKFL